MKLADYASLTPEQRLHRLLAVTTPIAARILEARCAECGRVRQADATCHDCQMATAHSRPHGALRVPETVA
jgi:hypothetical protein